MATASPKSKTGKPKKSKARRKVKSGIIHIKSTYNNTLISVTDLSGAVLAWSSSGRVGFGGTRKATPYAATQAVINVIEQLKPFGMEEAKVIVKGIGSARDSAIRAIGTTGISITSIRDMTPIPHNGVRPPRRRRV
jgi:small subunit ribosomal protein S11